jgi:hypothetical protein
LDDRDVSAEELSTLLREEKSGREPALPPTFPDRYQNLYIFYQLACMKLWELSKTQKRSKSV